MLPAQSDLIRRAAEGDIAAFQQLAREQADTLWRFAKALSGDRHLAEDLAQETLLEAWRSLARFDGRCQFSTWLYGILRNRFLKLREKRQRYAGTIDLNHASSIPVGKGSPDASAEQHEDAAALQRALAELPEAHRAVIELRFFAGASLEEIAQWLECPLGTVKSRLHLGLEKLRRMEISVNLFSSSREIRRDDP